MGLFELTKAHETQSFDYTKYVQHYQQLQHAAIESKIQKFQTQNKTRKRKQLYKQNDDEISHPNKKQKLANDANISSNVRMPLPLPIPLIEHKPKQNILMTPSPLPPIPMIIPALQNMQKTKSKSKSKSKKKKRRKKHKHKSKTQKKKKKKKKK